MQMGSHSQASDTTFKENDQSIINAGPADRRAAANLSRIKAHRKKALAKANSSSSSLTRSYGFDKSKGSVRGQQRKAELIRQGKITPTPVATPTPSVPKEPSVTINPKTPAPAPKKPTGPKPYVKQGGKATGSIKNYAIGSDARRKEYDARGWAYDDSIKRPKAKAAAASSLKSKPVSISTGPKLTPSISNITPKQTIASPQTKTPKVKQTEPNVKKADKNFSKMVKLRTKADIILGDSSMPDSRKQRKLGRLRKQYNRQATKHKQNRPSIGNAFKVNL